MHPGFGVKVTPSAVSFLLLIIGKRRGGTSVADIVVAWGCALLCCMVVLIVVVFVVLAFRAFGQGLQSRTARKVRKRPGVHFNPKQV